MKIVKIIKLRNGIYAHVCPLCGIVLASGSEPSMIPEFSICDCDRVEEKEPVYVLYEEGGYLMIRRTKSPRFTGKVTFGLESDIEDIKFIDYASALEAAKVLRKAAEFIRKRSRP